MFTLELWRKRRPIAYTLVGLLIAAIVIVFIILPAISWVMNHLPVIAKLFHYTIVHPEHDGTERVTPLEDPKKAHPKQNKRGGPTALIFFPKKIICCILE